MKTPCQGGSLTDANPAIEPIKYSSMSQTNKAGFTLVELLAVIGIAFVLAALLLPVLARAKEASRRAKCFSNERQLMLAWGLYSDDSGKIASNGFVRAGGDETKPLWVQGYYNHHANFPDCTNSALLIDPRLALFSAYFKDIKIYKCPSERGAFVDVKSGMKFAKLRSYAMNCYLGWLDAGPWKPKGPTAVKDCSIRSPSETFVFMDLNPESICWPFFGVETNDVFFNFPAIHHSRAASVSFADGHVAAKRWMDSRTTSFPEDLGWHDHHYLSPSNQDLAWISKHSAP